MRQNRFLGHIIALASVGMLLFATAASGQQKPWNKDTAVSLIAAIAKEYPNSAENPYSLIQIGETNYLVRDGKIVRTGPSHDSLGGMCSGYAAVWMSVSDENMREGSEGEGSMWKLTGGQWKEFAHSSAGDWECKDVRQIPMTIRRCLGARECS